ncbi:MAG TPA: hypothetical protein DCS67_01550 [Clostridiales bacterium UBA8960]|nr:hypothetical protein [Clostridiales bacterium UBA8960]
MEKEIMHHAIMRFNLDGVCFKLDDVATDLKISKKTIYKWYKNKEQLIGGIIDHLFMEIKLKEQSIIGDVTLSSLDRLIGVLSVYPDYERFNYSHIPALKATYSALYDKLERQLETNWEATFNLLDTCIDESFVVPIPHDIFKTIFLGLYKQLLLTEDDDPEKRMRVCIEYLFNGLKRK